MRKIDAKALKEELLSGNFTTTYYDRLIADVVPTIGESILDKIRAEIKAMFPPSGSWMYDEGHEVEHTVCEVLFDVLQIIDKYKEESEKGEKE